MRRNKDDQAVSINKNEGFKLMDIVAICIAAYEILGPILIGAFILFSVCMALVMNLWIR